MTERFTLMGEGGAVVSFDCGEASGGVRAATALRRAFEEKRDVAVAVDGVRMDFCVVAFSTIAALRDATPADSPRERYAAALERLATSGEPIGLGRAFALEIAAALRDDPGFCDPGVTPGKDDPC